MHSRKSNLSTKTASIRLAKTKFQEIDSRCSSMGCNRNDFIKKAINDALEFQNEPIPEIKVTAVSYDDGKTWMKFENT